jgi:hypothetical protein
MTLLHPHCGRASADHVPDQLTAGRAYERPPLDRWSFFERVVDVE